MNLRAWWGVAYFEVLQAARTRRGWAELATAALITWLVAVALVEGLASFEARTALNMGVAAPEVPGAMLDTFYTSAMYHPILSEMGMGPVPEELSVVMHPAGVFFYAFASVYVAASSAAGGAASLSQAVASGQLRFELLRVSREDVIVGRFVGFTLWAMAKVAVLALGFGLYLAWALRVDDLSILLQSVAVYTVPCLAFAWLGVGCGLFAGQWVGIPMVARFVALLTLGIWGIAPSLLTSDVLPRLGRMLPDQQHALLALGESLKMLSPAFWWSKLGSLSTDLLSGGMVLLAMGVLTASLGFVRFQRKGL